MSKPKINALGSFLSFLVITLVTSSCTPSTVKQNSAAQVTSKPTQEVAQKTQESDTLSVPVVLAAKFKIKPEKRELFLKLATATLQPTRAEAGSISYSFYEEANVPNSFIYFEEWKSREALAKHLEKSYVKNLVDKFPEMLDGEHTYFEWKSLDDETNETIAKGNVTWVRRGHRGGCYLKTEQLTFYRDVFASENLLKMIKTA